jgi:hypothetical protein
MAYPEEFSCKATISLERSRRRGRIGVIVKGIDRKGVTIAQGHTEVRASIENLALSTQALKGIGQPHDVANV